MDLFDVIEMLASICGILLLMSISLGRIGSINELLTILKSKQRKITIPSRLKYFVPQKEPIRWSPSPQTITDSVYLISIVLTIAVYVVSIVLCLCALIFKFLSKFSALWFLLGMICFSVVIIGINIWYVIKKNKFTKNKSILYLETDFEIKDVEGKDK